MLDEIQDQVEVNGRKTLQKPVSEAIAPNKIQDPASDHRDQTN